MSFGSFGSLEEIFFVFLLASHFKINIKYLTIL